MTKPQPVSRPRPPRAAKAARTVGDPRMAELATLARDPPPTAHDVGPPADADPVEEVLR